jgi:tetratricopeptide (TPR) repeat protein
MLDLESALASLKTAQELCVEHGNNKRLANVLEGIAFVYYSQGELESSLQAMQRSVELFQKFSTPLKVAFGMNNIGITQLALGQPFDAIDTFVQTVELARTTSRNLLATALANRAEALAYVGRFDDALADFDEAAFLLAEMDDEYGLIGTHLLWGFEYSCALDDWADAREHFEKANELISLRPDSFPEEKARLLIGLGQVELRVGNVKQAKHKLDEAQAAVEEKELDWWRPAVLYFQGLAKAAEQDQEGARACFEEGLKAVDRRGCPDYVPLNLLEMARLETDKQREADYLKACVQSAQKRARYVDRQLCLREAGEMLLQFPDIELIELGRDCLRRADKNNIVPVA